MGFGKLWSKGRQRGGGANYLQGGIRHCGVGVGLGLRWRGGGGDGRTGCKVVSGIDKGCGGGGRIYG
jgi:hypothetical protein